MTTAAVAEATETVQDAVATAQPIPADEEKKNSPVAREDFGTVSMAVFDREVALAAGGTFHAYNISVRRGYKTKDGEWHDQKMHLSLEEAQKLSLGLDEMVKEAYRHKAALRKK